MKCAGCGHENRGAAKFCEECAGPLKRLCASCGSELRPTAKFCDECGASVKDLAEPVIARAPAAPPALAPAVPTASHPPPAALPPAPPRPRHRLAAVDWL